MEKDRPDYGESEDPSYHIPEEIHQSIDSINEGTFWNLENLVKEFEHDVAFGMKMWGGMYEAVKRDGALPVELKDFNDNADKMLLAATSSREAAEHLLGIKKWLIEDWHIAPHLLTAKRILTDAYISEAEAMNELGINPTANPPFTTQIRLNSENPMVKEIIKQDNVNKSVEGGKLLEKLMSETPSLKRVVEEFHRNKNQKGGSEAF